MSPARARLPRRSAVLAGVALLLPLGAGAAAVPNASGAGPLARGPAEVQPAADAAAAQVPVVVSATRRHEAGAVAGATAAVTRAGGTVQRALPLVGAVAARVPAAALPTLAGDAAVGSVTPDAQMRTQDSKPAASDGDASTQASIDERSVYLREVGADRAQAAGVTGAGTTVALLDTGVTPLPDVADRLRPVQDDLTGEWAPCVNLSGEETCADSYGHGTFLAGLIAGDGTSSQGRHRGVAPGAELVSIKVAGADGSADVSTVLAGIQWAVTFRDRYDIGVLNLSLGTDSTQSWSVDPLNYAVERAWDAGIVVVVSSSNLGPAPGSIAKPADDPWVVTVGAVDDRQTPAIADDTLPNFSGRGPTSDGLVKPDVVAPGARLVSLDAPGSSISSVAPSSMGAPYRRGSGTSMSAAVVSGAAAQLLSARPGISPDRVKHLLTSTARPVASSSRNDVGSGMVDVVAALKFTEPGEANAGLRRSSGLGSLDASRGTVRVQTTGAVPTVLTGSLTAQQLAWDPVGTTTGDWSARTWYASPWYTARWFPTRWYASTWEGYDWHGAAWFGTPVETRPYGYDWHGAAWYGAWE